MFVPNEAGSALGSWSGPAWLGLALRLGVPRWGGLGVLLGQSSVRLGRACGSLFSIGGNECLSFALLAHDFLPCVFLPGTVRPTHRYCTPVPPRSPEGARWDQSDGGYRVCLSSLERLIRK